MLIHSHYDVIIIGTGAGGGSLAHRLAPSDKRILILERGDFLPREKENWNAREVYQNERYHTTEQWVDSANKPFRAQMSYWVGGNTKVYGAALIRFREKDFAATEHVDGISPEWPLTYQDFEPYYTQAEALYDVHGHQGDDPTEPTRSAAFPHPPISHEPSMQYLVDGLAKQGLKPFHLPLGLKLNEIDKTLSTCIRCDTCDGFPCLVQGKADSEVNGIQPIRHQSNITLLTQAKVLKLHTSPSGRDVTSVKTELNGDIHQFHGDIVVVACGAVNSAALLLNSANDKHPKGLANSSDQVGRNFMKHLTAAMVALNLEKNHATYQKTVAVSDFYWGDDDFRYPMGFVQNTGNVLKDMIPAEAPKLLAPFVKLVPGSEIERVAELSTGWWLQTEDLPDPQNRVSLTNGNIQLNYTPNNEKAGDRLLNRWTGILKAMERAKHIIPFGIYPRNKMPLQVVGHQCGTCRFGTDPSTSVLDIDCKAHDVDNLYVVDSSFFVSSSGVNPTLTIIANALRVGDRILERLSS
ncbi:MAG: GMC family oxidoreductase [Cyanobacteria bacterium P01_E01_bin.6]